MTVVVYFTLTMIKELEFLNANLNMAKKDVEQKIYAYVYQRFVYKKVVNHCLSKIQLAEMNQGTIIFLLLTFVFQPTNLVN